MTTILAVLGFAALFAAFGLLAPVLARRRCAGEGEGCGSCANAGHCELKEH